MDQRVAIHFGSRGLQDASTHAFCETEHVDSAHHAGLDRLHRIVLVMNRRRRTRKVVDLVDLEEYRLGDVVAQQLEELIVEQMKDVLAPAREKIIEAEHFISLADDPLTKMRPNEPRATRDKYSH